MLQESVEATLTPLLNAPFSDSIFLKDQTLVAGNNRILHKLERNYRGFVVSRLRPIVPTSGSSYTSISNARGDWSSFVPTITMSAGTWTTGTVNIAQFRQVGQSVEVQLTVAGTIAGAPTQQVRVAVPVPMAENIETGNSPHVVSLIQSGGVSSFGMAAISYTSGNLIFFAGPSSPNWAVGAASISFVGSYIARSINDFPQPLEVATTQPKTELVLSSTGGAQCDLVIF